MLLAYKFKSDRVTGGAAAYAYLSTANYVKHQSFRPMNTTRHLDHPIPGEVLEEDE